MKKKFVIFAVILIIVAILVAYYVMRPVDPAQALYGEANSLQAQGNYSVAIEKYGTLINQFPNSSYAESARKIRLPECYYNWSLTLEKQTKYGEAIEKYQILHTYPESDLPEDVNCSTIEKREVSCYIGWAWKLQNETKYSEAIEKYQIAHTYPEIYLPLWCYGSYLPIENRVNQCYLSWGLALENETRYSEAIEKYQMCGNETQMAECYYKWGVHLQIQKNYSEALEKYQLSMNSSWSEDASVACAECYDEWIPQLVAAEEYDEAIQQFCAMRSSNVPWEVFNTTVMGDIPADVLFTWVIKLQQEKSYLDASTLCFYIMNYHPGSEYASQAKEVSIEIEIAEIAEGDHGDWIRFSGIPKPLEGKVEYVITNDTSDYLTVLFSGPETKSMFLSAGATETITLESGNYKVAAKAGYNVIPQYGEITLDGNYQYSSTFHISPW
jgi:tetratricopeptide (TPR) repeat protein